MTDLPIIFSAPMVLALLAGRKTQTRRLAWKNTVWAPDLASERLEDFELRGWECRKANDGWEVRKPSPWQKVQPGDRLYVREAWRVGRKYDATPPRSLPPRRMSVIFQAGGSMGNADNGKFEPDFAWPYPNINTACGSWIGKERRSFHMPRWASRLTLIVEAVKVENLKEISHDDAVAEGCYRIEPCPEYPHGKTWGRLGFAQLWDSLHGVGAFDASPEVVALTFRVVKENIDRIKEAA
jgi:hypothetical protein